LELGARQRRRFQQLEQQRVATLVVILVAHVGEDNTMARPPKPPDQPSQPRFKGATVSKSGREGIFARLSALADAEAEWSDFTAFSAEARQESSHRGAAILMAANVELALDYAIIRFFSSYRTRLLFGINKPLGSFYNKILIAYAANIFGDETYDNLEIVRRVRNAFAHAQRPIKFDNEEISAACELIKIPTLIAPVMVSPAMAEDESAFGPRKKFEVVCERLAHNLGVWDFGGPIRIDRQAIKVYLDPRCTEIRATHPPLP
jgi:hypothetical protein